MIIHWLLAAVHLSAFGLALAAIATRNRAFKRVAAADSPQLADLRALFRADTAWGLTALVLIVTGLMRAFGGFEKGSAYYLHEPLFHLRMTALVVIVLLEIRPMLALIRWRGAVARGRRARRFARRRLFADLPCVGRADHRHRVRGGRHGAWRVRGLSCWLNRGRSSGQFF